MRLFDAGCQITYLFPLTCKSCRACCRGVKLLLIRRRLFALFARLRRFCARPVSIGAPAKLGCLL